MMATLIGRLCSTATASSWMVICSEPSPATQITSESGHATWAPTAEGRPKPIVPRPPELIQWFGPWQW